MQKKHSWYFLLFAVVAFSSCIKKEVTPLGDEGKTFVKLLGGGSPAEIVKNPIDFISTPQKILVCDIRKDAANNAALNTTTTVVIKDDTAAVRAANSAYLPLPAAWYTFESEAPKVGGAGGTFTFTFKPGEFAKQIYINVPNAMLLDPSSLYGIGFTISSVSADGAISNNKSVVIEIGAKNNWDGVYEMSGTFSDVTNATFTFDAPQQYSLVTISATKCVVRNDDLNSGFPGYVFNAGGSGSYYGSYGLVITFDPNSTAIASLHNYYGDPSLPATPGGNPAAGSGAPNYSAANSRRAVLDPSGINAVQGNKDIVIKHWMLQPSLVPSGPRCIFDETWKYLGPR
jgi:hypothetical protein